MLSVLDCVGGVGGVLILIFFDFSFFVPGDNEGWGDFDQVEGGKHHDPSEEEKKEDAPPAPQTTTNALPLPTEN